jgi:hypothetical protein
MLLASDRGFETKLKGKHGRMARGDHGLPKVLHGPAMPYPSTPYRRATPETALQPFKGWPACKAGGLVGRWPAAVSYPFGHPMPYAYEEEITSTKAFVSFFLSQLTVNCDHSSYCHYKQSN